MSTELITYGVGAVALAVVGFVVWNLVRGYQRVMTTDNFPLLLAMLGRRGLVQRDLVAAGDMTATAAVRRCAFCNSTTECREFLASGKRAGFEAFCPNAEVIQRLNSTTE
jgi:hypothetical protein